MSIFCIFFLFTLLTSCNSSSRWKYEEMSASQNKFRSGKLLCKCNDTFRGFEFELLHLRGKTLGYINVFTQAIPSLANNDHAASLKIFVEGEEYDDIAHLLEGGQRLLLKEEITALIISSLLEGKTVSIYLDGYEEKLDPKDFFTNYQKLRSLP